jgi:tRNA threonylcarbamoyladenosine biosynthesis protein TsaB
METGGQSTRAVGMVEEALREAQVQRGQIERIAVGLGPGSYTGIRAAIALAQGWQLARDVQLLGVSSADCVAAQAHSEGLSGSVAVVIDAQRGEYYLATYELTASGWAGVLPLKLASATAVQAAQTSGHLLVGPEVVKWFPAGRVILPQAALVGRLAIGRTDFVSGEKLEPIYLRQTTFVKAPPPRVLPF